MKKILENKIFRIATKTIEIIFFAVIILYLIFIVFQRLSNNKAIMGYRAFTVATESMKKVYNVGDVIVVKEVNPDTLKVGDDVTYYGTKDDFAGKIITHRIIDIDDSTGKKVFTTKGVANPVEDPTITEDQLYGKVLGKLLFITFISTTIRSQYGFFFIIFVPIVLILFTEVADAIVEAKEARRKKDGKE